MHGWKTIEIRLHTRFAVLGERPTRIAIHAAQQWDPSATVQVLRCRYLTQEQVDQTNTLVKQHPVGGHVIGTILVEAFEGLSFRHSPEALIECHTVRYGLFLRDPVSLVPPVKTRGYQGMFKVTIPKPVKG